MTPEAQRIAIAEACGWSQLEDRNQLAIGGCWVGYPPTSPIIGKKELIPDYLNDLNACQEFPRQMIFSKRQAYYLLLQQICSRKLNGGLVHPFECAHAEASEKCEAFLRAIDKWQESTPSKGEPNE